MKQHSWLLSPAGFEAIRLDKYFAARKIDLYDKPLAKRWTLPSIQDTQLQAPHASRLQHQEESQAAAASTGAAAATPEADKGVNSHDQSQQRLPNPQGQGNLSERPHGNSKTVTQPVVKTEAQSEPVSSSESECDCNHCQGIFTSDDEAQSSELNPASPRHALTCSIDAAQGQTVRAESDS